MKKTVLVMMAGMVMVLAGLVNATIVDITVETDKPVYQLGEDVVVSVIAINLTDEPIQLGFGSTLQASYLMDGVFDWSEDKIFLHTPTGQIIEPYDYYTWDLIHGSDEMELYPLDIGIHSVTGEVIGYGYSSPIEFEVIPEPATVLLFGTGIFWLRGLNV